MKVSAWMGAACAAVLSMGAAQGATVNFANIPGGDSVGDAYVSRFSLDVTQFTPTTVLISVKSAVAAGANYFIGGIFIDDLPGNALGSETAAFRQAQSSSGVRFAYSGSGGDLPQGNNIGFGKTSKYLAKNGSGNAWAIQPGEFAGFVFDGNLATVMAAFASGGLRFGLHVQNLPGSEDGSDSYVTQTTTAGPPTPAPVPLPASGGLLLGVLGWLAWRRRA